MRIKSPSTAQEFDQYFELRWRILRKPWQQTRGSERDNDEDSSYHLMVLENNLILGVARLQNISPNEAQLRYMAVDENNHGRGIGKAIVHSMEDYARKNNITSIMLHARETAVGFYLSMGYDIQQKSYLLFDNIQHYKMNKEL